MQTIRLFIVVVVFFAGLSVEAQEFHIEKNPAEIISHPHWGPNRSHFGHLYTGLGILIPIDQSIEPKISVPLSGGLLLGYRFRIKIINGLFVGADVNLNSTKYRFKRGEGIPPFGPEILARERVTLGNGEAGLFLRFRFGQRGDYLGRYIDIGVGSQLNLLSRYQIKQRDLISATAKEVKVTYSDLDIITPWVYLMTARIGFDRWSIFGKYRFGKLIGSEDPVQDLPRQIIGIELALVSY